jgi:hypothetical protein
MFNAAWDHPRQDDQTREYYLAVQNNKIKRENLPE